EHGVQLARHDNVWSFAWGVAVDDFNEDGNWDFIAAGNNDNLRYLEGNGDGTFTRHTITNNAPGSQARGKAAGDVNNDGHADLVMTERSTGKVYAYLGDGTGSFSAPIYLFTTYSEWWSTSTYRDPYGLAVADFNNDGSVDIITNDGSPGLYSLWIGDGALNFTRARTLFDFSNHGSLDPFDIDRDGDMDFIVIENYYGGRIYSATNWEDGTIWTTKQIIAYNSGSSGHRSLMAVSTPPSQPTFETSGTYVSSIHDTGDAQSRITHVIYEATDNANQTVTVQVRSSNNPSMMGASPWETVDPDDNTLSTPAGQYIQYRVILTSTKRSTPVLESMRIRYQTNPSWITGQVENTGGYVVADAEVSFWTGGLKVARDVTDGSGNYRIGVSPGTYTLRVQCKDYNPYRESVTIVGDAVNDMEISYRNFIEFTHPADFAGGNFTNTTLDETHDALALATNMALDRPVFSNRSSWANWDLHYLVDGTITRRFHATVNAGAGTGYMNPQWVAVDLGDQVEIAAIDYYMSYDTRFWQSGFRIAVYTDYDAGTKTFSGETIIVDYPKGTWTSAEDCPNRFVFENGAIFQASNGGNVSGWLPGTSTVTGRYVKVFNVYGNYSNSDLWHYYRIAELSVFAPSMSGEYISAIWNVTDDDRQVSAVQWHSDVPAGTSLSVSIRTGETVADLLSAPWTHVTNRQYGFTPPLEGQFIQYRVQMTSSDGTSTPRLRDIMLFAYEHPAWISGNVTHAVIGTSLPLAGVTVQQDAGLLLPFTILTDASGYYLAPVEYPTTGYLDYTLNVSKNGFRDGTDSARITPASVDITLDIQLDAGDDWTEMWGNPEHTSSTFLPSNIVAQGVSWKAYIGGYAGWGVIADVNLDNRNDIVMLYGDRVVAKTPDDVLLWVGETSDVDRIIGIYDLDKNGIIDIVAAKRTPARISIINGLNGSLEYEMTWPTKSLHQYAPDNIVVDDFDGSMDGKYEVIIKLNDGRLRAWTFKTVDWRAVPETMWDIAYTYDSKNSIAVGDVDLDGVKDVVVLTPYRITVYNAEDGSFKYDRVISSSPYRVGGSVVIR
ncbi:MAG TPA: hypothetical protein EYP43_04435, partial [Thermoplasmata archaeon]|nr:hypothetical protein [Thermoplasmata archaeon]